MRSLVLACAWSLLAACSGPAHTTSTTASGATCTPGSTLTYDDFGQPFMTAYCTRCHASSLVGSTARSSAPVGLDFDTVEGIREDADRIDAQAAHGPARANSFMPPTAPFPTPAERSDLGVWLACGAP